jgi:hypothetical protein
MEKYTIDLPAFRSLHRFGDALEQAIRNIQEPDMLFTPARQAKDSIGRHWYGTRCHFIDLSNGNKFYLHIGLIYLPETRIGLMVEVDGKNNRERYDVIWEQIRSGETFVVSRDEPAYLKLFLKENLYDSLQTAPAARQIQLLTEFVLECGRAIAASAH